MRGLVPGAELGDPGEEGAEAQEVLEELRLGGRAVVAVGVLEGDHRRDPGLFDGGQPGGHGGEVAGAGDDVPGDDVAGDVDPELGHAGVGEGGRFVVGEAELEAGGGGRRRREGRGREAGQREAGRQQGERGLRGNREHGYAFNNDAPRSERFPPADSSA